MSKFCVEGNAGGDRVQIEPLDNDTVKLLVGHCCVYTIRAVVPVEFITAALTKAVDDAGGIEALLRGVGWQQDYTDRLVAKVKPLSWVDPW